MGKLKKETSEKNDSHVSNKSPKGKLTKAINTREKNIVPKKEVRVD